MTDDAALATLRRYFACLDSFDVEAALDCFSDDAVYVHPPYNRFYDVEDGDASSEDAHVAEGRDALRELFTARGKQSTSHHVTQFARSGSLCFNEGVMLDAVGDTVCTWLACFEVDEFDRVSRYIPYASVPALPLIRTGATPTRRPK